LKLLVSPKNPTEAAEAIAGGADIIDVKNPAEGPLGANYPWVIRSIKELTPKSLEVSCTIGEASSLPGSISLAAFGAASLGVNYIKVGLNGFKKAESTIEFLANVRRAAKEAKSNVKIVAAGYADAHLIKAIDPQLIPEIAQKAQVDVVMLDTATKDGKCLFDYQTKEQLQKFVNAAHKSGLLVALAGSLRKQDLLTVYQLGADIAGVRGAACTNCDRMDGQMTRELVAELVKTVKQSKRN
jgi:(5-formylfuran-3-yl)methyl phosphate synthase